jgi:hypothetical protein
MHSHSQVPNLHSQLPLPTCTPSEKGEELKGSSVKWSSSVGVEFSWEEWSFECGVGVAAIVDHVTVTMTMTMTMTMAMSDPACRPGTNLQGGEGKLHPYRGAPTPTSTTPTPLQLSLSTQNMWSWSIMTTYTWD